MIYATTITAIVILCAAVYFIFIHKTNVQHISEPKQETKKEVKSLSMIDAINKVHSISSGLGIWSGTPPDLFGRTYKPNQRKNRKRKRQNSCI